jgi:hypothetical protein
MELSMQNPVILNMRQEIVGFQANVVSKESGSPLFLRSFFSHSFLKISSNKNILKTFKK